MATSSAYWQACLAVIAAFAVVILVSSAKDGINYLQDVVREPAVRLSTDRVGSYRCCC
jgi:hypothetical protein